MGQNNRKDIIYLHIAVMMFGVAGVIGQFVEVPSVMVALGRVICSSILLLITLSITDFGNNFVANHWWSAVVIAVSIQILRISLKIGTFVKATIKYITTIKIIVPKNIVKPNFFLPFI